jgi:hypothetical protein
VHGLYIQIMLNIFKIHGAEEHKIIILPKLNVNHVIKAIDVML